MVQVPPIYIAMALWLAVYFPCLILYMFCVHILYDCHVFIYTVVAITYKLVISELSSQLIA